MRFKLGWKEISRAEGAILGPGHWGALSPSQHSCTVALRPAQERAGVLSVSGGLSCASPRKMKAVLVRFRGAFWGLVPREDRCLQRAIPSVCRAVLGRVGSAYGPMRVQKLCSQQQPVGL